MNYSIYYVSVTHNKDVRQSTFQIKGTATSLENAKSKIIELASKIVEEENGTKYIKESFIENIKNRRDGYFFKTSKDTRLEVWLKETVYYEGYFTTKKNVSVYQKGFFDILKNEKTTPLSPDMPVFHPKFTEFILPNKIPPFGFREKMPKQIPPQKVGLGSVIGEFDGILKSGNFEDILHDKNSRDFKPEVEKQPVITAKDLLHKELMKALGIKDNFVIVDKTKN